MHHVAFLRNSVAHKPQPSLEECIAGVSAMSDVVRAHGDEGTAEKLQQIMHDLKLLTGLEPGCVTEVALEEAAFSTITLELALEDFCKTVGQEVHERWHPKHAAPQVPMEVKIVVAKLRNSKGGLGDGKNPSLVKVRTFSFIGTQG